MRFKSLLLIALCLGAVSFARAADPMQELASFSDFKQVDLESLAGGSIATSRGSLMKFARGISTQACFVVQAPAAHTARVLLNWSGLEHPELEVHVHETLQGNGDEGFQALRGALEQGYASQLVKKVGSLDPASFDLQISHEEAASVDAARKAAGGSDASAAFLFWKGVLTGRARAFHEGGLKALPLYEPTGSRIAVQKELDHLLAEVPGPAGHFEDLLRATLDTSNRKPVSAASGLQREDYWELLMVEGDPTLNLGATFLRKQEESWEVLDCSYYVTGGYYLNATLYQLWPVRVNGREMTLVWRGDLLSAPTLAYTHGMERMATEMIMLKEIGKTIQFFRGDAARSAVAP